jgi:hypothetical protein
MQLHSSMAGNAVLIKLQSGQYQSTKPAELQSMKVREQHTHAPAKPLSTTKGPHVSRCSLYHGRQLVKGECVAL